MGGRGASSGMSVKGIPYGEEYETVATFSNVKFVRYKNGAPTPPLETMTKGRVYATVSDNDEISFISYHDKVNKKSKVIDLGKPHKGMQPHAHHGYLHNELDGPKGATKLNSEEQKLVDSVLDFWYNKRGK